MSQLPLDSTPIDTNMTNAKKSHLDSTPIVTKMPYPKLITRPTELSKRKGKENAPEDPESDPSLSDSSSSKSDSSDDSQYRKSRSKNKYNWANDSKYSK